MEVNFLQNYYNTMPNQAPPQYGGYSYNQRVYPPSPPPKPPIDPKEQLRRTEMSKLRRISNGLGFFVLAYHFAMYGIVIVVEIFFLLFSIDVSSDSTAEYLLDIAASVGASLIPGVAYLLITRRRRTPFFKKGRVGLTTLIPVTLICMAVAMLANAAADLFIQELDFFGIQNHLSMTADSTLSPFQIVLYVIAVAIVPAFAEEFGFRGIIMGRLRQYGDAFAIVASAIMFSAMHANTTQIVFTFFLGLLFGYVDCLTDSIIPSIVGHFLNNFYAVIFDVLQNQTNIDMSLFYILYLGVVVVFCLGGLLSYIYLTKRDKGFMRLSDRDRSEYPNVHVLTFKEKVNTFIKNPGVIISLVSFLMLTINYLLPENFWTDIFKALRG